MQIVAFAPVPESWHKRFLDLARLHAAPSPDSGEYVLLLRLWSQRDLGAMPAQLAAEMERFPAEVRALREDAWVQRFLECSRLDAAGLDLGGGKRTAWLSKQRRLRESGSLPEGRVVLLSGLHGFSWTPDADQWDCAFEQVRHYVSCHAKLPGRGDDPALAGWLAAQRFAARRGRLGQRREEVLHELPGWTASLGCSRSKPVWQARLNELRQFVEALDRYPSPTSTRNAERELASWVAAQRAGHRRGDLSLSRSRMLADLPRWRWSLREADFDARILELHNDLQQAPLSTRHRLYSWVVAQRRRHREGLLPPEQVEILRSMNLLDGRLASTG